MSKDTGGPAFPYHGPDSGKTGMTLRDYFAAKAMCEFINHAMALARIPNVNSALLSNVIDKIPAQSWEMADAMLKARSE